MKLNNDTLIFKGSTPWNGKVFRGTTLIWPTAPVDYSTEYLTFAVVGSSAGTLNFNISQFAPAGFDIEFSKNGGEWVSYTASTAQQRSVSAGDKIRIKGNNAAYSFDDGQGNWYDSLLNILHATYKIYGNIMSLVYGDSFEGQDTLTEQYCFHYLFSQSGCISAENLILPAMNLTNGCYMGLFYYCNNLTVAPKLPSVNIAPYCYAMMFYHTAIATAPDLEATAVTSSNSSFQSYFFMFSQCSNLQYVRCLLADPSSLGQSMWLWGVSPTGTFIKHPNATWPTGDSGIPSGWTVQDAVL